MTLGLRAILFLSAIVITLIISAAGLLWSYVSLSTTVIPELARELPPGYAEAKQVFKARVVENFEPGTPASDLVNELVWQGFTLADGWNRASFEAWKFPCMRQWHISWERQGERLTGIFADYSYYCL